MSGRGNDAPDTKKRDNARWRRRDAFTLLHRSAAPELHLPVVRPPIDSSDADETNPASKVSKLYSCSGSFSRFVYRTIQPTTSTRKIHQRHNGLLNSSSTDSQWCAWTVCRYNFHGEYFMIMAEWSHQHGPLESYLRC